MSVNDYVEVVLWQNSGSNLTVAASSKFQAEFMMHRIG
jgi:hypothetical protein